MPKWLVNMHVFLYRLCSPHIGLYMSMRMFMYRIRVYVRLTIITCIKNICIYLSRHEFFFMCLMVKVCATIILFLENMNDLQILLKLENN